ncbi:hypothetical protein HaloA020_35820 [Halomonas sp. A020]|nr:hypothetical protein HaloA020_35820 [Halomonas sp. A020]
MAPPFAPGRRCGCLLRSHSRSFVTPRYETLFPLFTTYYSPLTTHHSLLTTYYSPFTTYYSPFTIYHSLFTIYQSQIHSNAGGDGHLVEDLRERGG